MKKPHSLREALIKALDPKHRISDRPADFHMKVLNLSPQASARPGAGFLYKYTLVLGFLDFAGSSAEITVPLMRWIQRWQHDLLTAEKPFTMDVDLLSDNLIDAIIHLELTEAVCFVEREDGAVDVEFVAEPTPMALRDGAPLHAVYLDGELIAHCEAHPAEGL